MENGMLSASDVALLEGNGKGGDGYMGIFGLLILLGILNGGFGGFGNGRAGAGLATTEDVNNAQQFGQILDGNRDIMTQANNNTNAITSAVNASEYETINVVKDSQMQLQDRLADLHAGQRDIMSTSSQCCCNIRMDVATAAAAINQNIMQNRYESALNTASINATTTAQTQKILDAMSGNRIADLQNQVNQLQLAQATSGMLKFPNQWTYAGGFFPPLFPPVTTPTTGGTTTG